MATKMDRERTEECLDPPAAQKGSHRPREGDKGGQVGALARSVTPCHRRKQTRVSSGSGRLTAPRL